MDHLHRLSPGFGQINHAKGLVRRFRRSIDIVDSTTIQLIARCIDWAKHRRRKAAAKCHLRLNLQSLLPRFAMVDTAGENDAKRAREVCAGISEGGIVIFDKAYLDFGYLWDLCVRGIFWVTRAKENLQYRVVKRLLEHSNPKILRNPCFYVLWDGNDQNIQNLKIHGHAKVFQMDLPCFESSSSS